MMLQCAGSLDFIFNGIEQNSALEISDQSSKRGQALKLATFFAHVSQNKPQNKVKKLILFLL